jgi:hypothetical protein
MNRQVVRATAMAVWNAYMSDDGTNGTKEPSRQLHVRQRQPDCNNKTDQSNSGRRGPGPD